jgi:hypothetical protein
MSSNSAVAASSSSKNILKMESSYSGKVAVDNNNDEGSTSKRLSFADDAGSGPLAVDSYSGNLFYSANSMETVSSAARNGGCGCVIS